MEENRPLNVLPNDEFFVWYRNGCTSGLNTQQAIIKFESLSNEDQQELRTEYDNNRRIILEGGSGWTAPFAG